MSSMGGAPHHGGERGIRDAKATPEPPRSHDFRQHRFTNHPSPFPSSTPARRPCHPGDRRILRRPSPPVNTGPGLAYAQGPTPSDLKNHAGSLIVAAGEGSDPLDDTIIQCLTGLDRRFRAGPSLAATRSRSRTRSPVKRHAIAAGNSCTWIPYVRSIARTLCSGGFLAGPPLESTLRFSVSVIHADAPHVFPTANWFHTCIRPGSLSWRGNSKNR